MDFLLWEEHKLQECYYVLSKINISKHFHNFTDTFVFQYQKESYPPYFFCSLFSSKLSSEMYNKLNSFCKHTSYILQQSSHTCPGHQILTRIAVYSQSQTLILKTMKHDQEHHLKLLIGSPFSPQLYLFLLFHRIETEELFQRVFFEQFAWSAPSINK